MHPIIDAEKPETIERDSPGTATGPDWDVEFDRMHELVIERPSRTIRARPGGGVRVRCRDSRHPQNSWYAESPSLPTNTARSIWSTSGIPR